MSLSEIEAAETVGGPTMLTGTTVTDSDNAFGGVGANLRNGSRGDYYHSDGAATPHWIRFDFGSTPGDWRWLPEIRVCPRGGFASQAPKAFTWSYSSDGVVWTDLITVSGLTDASWDAASGFPNVYQAAGIGAGAAGYKFYRLIVNNTVSGVNAGAELRLRASGVNQTPMISLVSSQFGGSTIDKLFDGDVATVWSGSGEATSTLSFEMAAKVLLTDLQWTARNDGFHSQAPNTITLQGSHDRVTWTQIVSQTGLTWTSGETKTI